MFVGLVSKKDLADAFVQSLKEIEHLPLSDEERKRVAAARAVTKVCTRKR